MTLIKRIKMVYNGFEGGIFPLPNQSIFFAEAGKSSSSEHQEKWKIHCFMKSESVLYMEKYKRVMQKSWI